MPNDIQTSILKSIDAVVGQRINDLKLDKTVVAVVRKVVNSVLGIYEVEYNGGFFNAYAATENTIYTPGTSVYVQIPQNNMSNDKYILSRAYNIKKENVTETVMAMTDNYNIVGSNRIIKGKKAGQGFDGADSQLISYHDREDSDGKLEHRANFIYTTDVNTNPQYYSFDNEEFKLAFTEENAKALMIEADFLTSLDDTQKRVSSGTYGLAFDIVFNNPSYNQYGITAQEILEYFWKDISADSVTLKSYIDGIWDDETKKFKETLWTPNDLKSQNGILDEAIKQIKNLDASYAKTHPASYVATAKDIVQSYIILLTDLRDGSDDDGSPYSTVAGLEKEYQNWQNTQLAPDKTTVKTYIFTNNDMTGTPFSYDSWSSQYKIIQDIDFKYFDHIENIIFFQDGFNQNPEKEKYFIERYKEGSSTEVASTDEILKYDIFVKNLRVYALQPISNENGDYSLQVGMFENGNVFKQGDTSENPTIKVTATLKKQVYEDVTQNAFFWWFKQDGNVTNSRHPYYNINGGIGWSLLNTDNKSASITIAESDTYLYKNKYKVVAKIEDTYVLSEEFNIYNRNKTKGAYSITSSIGPNFSFGQGEDLILSIVQGDPKTDQFKTITYENLTVNNNEELSYLWVSDNFILPEYLFKWYIELNGIQYSLSEELESAWSNEYNNTLNTSKYKINLNNLPLNNLSKTDICKNVKMFTTIPIDEKTELENCTTLSEILNYFTKTRYNYSLEYQNDSKTLSSKVAELINNVKNKISSIAPDKEPDLNETYNSLRYKDNTLDVLLNKQIGFPYLGNKINYPVNNLSQAEATFYCYIYTPCIDNDPSINSTNLNDIGSFLNSQNWTIEKIDDNNNNQMVKKSFSDFFEKWENEKDHIETIYDINNVINEDTNELRQDSEGNLLDSSNSIYNTINDIWIKLENKTKENLINEIESTKTTAKQNWLNFQRYIILGHSNLYQQVDIQSITLYNENDATVSGYRIDIENGNQIFQYDEYGTAPNDSKFASPQEILPLICHFYDPNGEEIPETNYEVTWYLPVLNTMIIPANLLSLDPSNQETYTDTNKQCIFNIAKLYDNNRLNNQILCQVKINGKIFNATTNLYWGKSGSNGTNGTDVVARIIPKENNNIYPLTQEPLTLYITNGGNGSYNYRWNNNTPLNTVMINNILQLELYQKGNKITPSSTTWNLIGNLKDTGLSDCKNFTRGSSTNLTISWEKESSKSVDTAIIKTNHIIQGKTSTGTDDDVKTYYAHFPLYCIKYENTTIPTNPIVIDKQSLLTEIIYNNDGRNPLYSHTQGVKLLNTRNYHIEWTVAGGANDDASTAEIKISADKDSATGVTTLIGKSGAAENELSNKDMIYIIPADAISGQYGNNRVEARLYTTYNETDKIFSGLIATVYIPIYMGLNAFGLASINAWDGNSIKIDDANGAVLAPQVGAGEKDTNNKFTGILMGKEIKSDEERVGLFGYNKGIQSIFLNSKDGSATFGVPDGYHWVTDKVTDTGTTIPAHWEENEDSENTENNFDEGRIQLIPNGESTIGGWKIGRGSLYYTYQRTKNITKKTNGTYDVKFSRISNLGKIGPAWDDEFSSHEHFKDIAPRSTGILLNAYPRAYISIKGRPLRRMDNEIWTTLNPTQKASAEEAYDIINKTGNAVLKDGDSLELNLDPNQTGIFTIYRVFQGKDEQGKTIWKRNKQVGIDSDGRFYTNAIKDGESSFSTSYLPAFGAEALDQAYIGSQVVLNDNILAKNFIQVKTLNTNNKYIDTPDTDGTHTLFISGGDKSNEYKRPISIHGKTVSLYAADSNTSQTTDSYIKISSSEGRIQRDANSFISVKNNEINIQPTTYTYKDDNNKDVTENRGLFLTTSSTNRSYLKTSNFFELKIGNTGTSSLTINSGAVTATTGAITAETKNITVKAGTGNISVTTTGTATVTTGTVTATTGNISATTGTVTTTSGDTHIIIPSSLSVNKHNTILYLNRQTDQGTFTTADLASNNLTTLYSVFGDYTVKSFYNGNNLSSNDPDHYKGFHYDFNFIRQHPGATSQAIKMGVYQFAKSGAAKALFNRLQIEDTDINVIGGGLTIGGPAKDESNGEDQNYSLVTEQGINIKAEGLTINNGGLEITKGNLNLSSGYITASKGLKVTGVLGENIAKRVSPVDNTTVIKNIAIDVNTTNAFISAYSFVGSGHHLTDTADWKDGSTATVGPSLEITEITPGGSTKTFSVPYITNNHGRPKLYNHTVTINTPDLSSYATTSALADLASRVATLESTYVTKTTFNAHKHSMQWMPTTFTTNNNRITVVGDLGSGGNYTDTGTPKN